MGCQRSLAAASVYSNAITVALLSSADCRDSVYTATPRPTRAAKREVRREKIICSKNFNVFYPFVACFPVFSPEFLSTGHAHWIAFCPISAVSVGWAEWRCNLVQIWAAVATPPTQLITLTPRAEIPGEIRRQATVAARRYIGPSTTMKCPAVALVAAPTGIPIVN